MKKAIKDFTEKDYKEFSKKQEEAMKKFKEQNNINSILLFGICDFGNKIISNIKDMPHVAKLYTETDKKSLEKFNKKDTYLFLEDYKLSQGIWDKNNYSKIHKHILENKQEIIDKIKEYDYVIICTSSGDKMNNCLSEAVADICSETNKRFMICHTRDKYFCTSFLDLEKLTKRRSIRFINKMKKKKYLINEIIQIDTSFVCDKAEFEYKGKNYQTYGFTNADLTYSSEFNCKIFAKTVEYNIIKMLEV